MVFLFDRLRSFFFRAKPHVLCKYLFEAVMKGSSDDVKAMHHKNLELVQRLERMEERCSKRVSELDHLTLAFWKEHSHMEPKDYAKLAKETFKDERVYVNLAMKCYIETSDSLDVQDFCLRNCKALEIIEPYKLAFPHDPNANEIK